MTKVEAAYGLQHDKDLHTKEFKNGKHPLIPEKKNDQREPSENWV